MGNWQSTTPSEKPSSPPLGGSSSTSNSNILGHLSGNSNSNNVTINFSRENTNPSPNCAQILQCLYTSRYKSHRERVSEPAKGTCTWVTRHPKYVDWSQKETSSLLWLSADPGCGKSVIASFLVGHLTNQESAIVCYFFFKDDNDKQKSAKFALCAILHQLFVQKKSLCKYAEEAFDATGEKFTGEVETLWDILVKAVADEECGDVVCVVDALDECEEDTLTPLIRRITRLPASQSSDVPLRFLVTSRPYHNIERELSSEATTIRLKGEDEVNAIASDVSRVIDEGIKALESYWGQPGELGCLRDLLESSADRTFLWVSLVLEILKDSGNCLLEEFTNIISTAPHDLAKLYTKILDRNPCPGEARRILNIVVAAARPLTLREMSIAFRVRREHNTIKDLEDLPSGFEKTVKNLCGLFVRVIDSKIYLVHQTAREFLIKGSLAGQGNWQYTFCPKDSNFMMADICISYLSREEFVGSPLAIDNDGEVSATAVNDYLQKHSFLDYAARYWPDHFRDSHDQEMNLFEFTQQICGNGPKHNLTWFQVYWFNTRPGKIFPKDFTHLMIGSMLGQGAVVDRLLEEEQGDPNARSEIYGTALNIAAVEENEGMVRRLLERNVKAYFRRKEYNISQMHSSELEKIGQIMRTIRRAKIKWAWGMEAAAIRRALERLDQAEAAAKFLKRFSVHDTPDLHAVPNQVAASSTTLGSD